MMLVKCLDWIESRMMALVIMTGESMMVMGANEAGVAKERKHRHYMNASQVMMMQRLHLGPCWQGVQQQQMANLPIIYLAHNT